MPIAFALLAGLSRLSLPETYSRYQVLAFAIGAMIVELVRHRDARPQLRAASYAANVLAAFVAIVFVKWQLEGVSLSHWARVLAATI